MNSGRISGLYPLAPPVGAGRRVSFGWTRVRFVGEDAAKVPFCPEETRRRGNLNIDMLTHLSKLVCHLLNGSRLNNRLRRTGDVSRGRISCHDERRLLLQRYEL